MTTRKMTEDYVGTCQACFGEFKCSDKKQMVLHGYERPGFGFVVGQCGGVGHSPFEYACELTKQIIIERKEMIAQRTAYLNKLIGGEITTLTREWTEYERVDGVRRAIEKREKINFSSQYWEGEFRHEKLSSERYIKWFTDLVNYAQGRVDNWKLEKIIGIDTEPTGRIRGLRDAYDPDVEAEKQRLAAKRAERDARPGKFKLCLFWTRKDQIGWEELSDIEIKAVRTWATATFSVGKTRVVKGYDFSDVPRSIRMADKPAIHRHVMMLNVDWSYLDKIGGIVPDMTQMDFGKKQVEFFKDVTGCKPWEKQ